MTSQAHIGLCHAAASTCSCHGSSRALPRRVFQGGMRSSRYTDTNCGCWVKELPLPCHCLCTSLVLEGLEKHPQPTITGKPGLSTPLPPSLPQPKSKENQTETKTQSGTPNGTKNTLDLKTGLQGGVGWGVSQGGQQGRGGDTVIYTDQEKL